MTPEERAKGLHVLGEPVAAHWRDLTITVDSLVKAGAPLHTLLVALAPPQEIERNEAYKTAADWATGRTGILVLSGDVGVGKSIAAARYVLSENTFRRGAAWADAASLGFLPFVQAEQRLRDLSRIPCLVLDDLGRQGSTTPIAVDRLSSLIMQRHAAGKPTVITSNKDIEEIATIYDAVEEKPARAGRPALKASDQSRIADRIRENGYYLECRRPQGSFRASGDGASPNSEGNRYRVAQRGLHLFGLLTSGATDQALLDELQTMIGADDESVARAAASVGFTAQAQAEVAALLFKLSVSRESTCSATPSQHSTASYGTMDAVDATSATADTCAAATDGWSDEGMDFA